MILDFGFFVAGRIVKSRVILCTKSETGITKPRKYVSSFAQKDISSTGSIPTYAMANFLPDINSPCNITIFPL